jgi:hypothetical protein
MEEAAIDMRGKIEDAFTMIEDLKGRRVVLDKEQLERRKGFLERGISPEQAEFIEAIENTSGALETIQNDQLRVQEDILRVLSAQLAAGAEEDPEERRKIFRKAVADASYDQLKKAVQTAGAGGAMGGFRRDIMGIGETGETSTLLGSSRREIGAIGPGIGSQLQGGDLETFKSVQAQMIDKETRIAQISDYQHSLTSSGFNRNEAMDRQLDILRAELGALTASLLECGA